MTNPYGPWATAINAGRNPQLSAFWRQRLTMLVPVSRTSPVLCPRNLLGLLALAALIGVLPTFHAAPVVADQKNVADEKIKTIQTQPADEAKRAESLTYTGKVVDADTGKPIEGATVVISTTIWSDSGPHFPVLERTKHRTDATGTYRFTIPPDQVAQPNLYLVVEEVSHPRYATSPVGGYGLRRIREDEKLGARPFFEKLSLPPGEEISGTVLPPEGKPAAGVTVIANSQRANGKYGWIGSSAKTVTNDQGVFRVNVIKDGSGSFTLLPKQYSPSGHLLERPGDQGRFILEKGTSLQGRVVNVLGKPLAGVWVNASLMKSAFVPPKGQPEAGQLSFVRTVGAHVRRAALSNEKGEFLLAALPPGLYGIVPFERSEDDLIEDESRHPLPAVFLRQDVTLGEGEAAHSVEIRAIPSVTIEIQWLDSAGKPHKGNSAHCEGKILQTHEPWGAEGWADSSGRTSLLAPKWLRDARLQLMVGGAVRYRKAKDAPLINDQNVPLGTLNEDVRGITAICYRSPTVVVKAVADDGTPVKDFKPKAVYPAGVVTRDPRGRWLTGVEGDVYFVPQHDGRWHSEGLLPDQEFTLRLEAPGHKPNSQKLSLTEGVTKELVVKLRAD